MRVAIAPEPTARQCGEEWWSGLDAAGTVAFALS
jgi:hypothetical protein